MYVGCWFVMDDLCSLIWRYFFYTRQCTRPTFFYKSAISGRRRADIDVLKRKK